MLMLPLCPLLSARSGRYRRGIPIERRTANRVAVAFLRPVLTAAPRANGNGLLRIGLLVTVLPAEAIEWLFPKSFSIFLYVLWTKRR